MSNPDRQRTPHELALSIAEDNVIAMEEGSTNCEGLGAGERAARRFKAAITKGMCGSCARLSADDERHVGCSYDFNSPGDMARELDNRFLHELQCAGYIALAEGFDPFTDDDGVTRYNYRKSLPQRD